MNNLSKYLLDDTYNHVNLAKLNLCELRRKRVIITNKICPESKLNNIINSSTDKPYINRVTFKELNNIRNIKIPKWKFQIIV